MTINKLYENIAIQAIKNKLQSVIVRLMIFLIMGSAVKRVYERCNTKKIGKKIRDARLIETPRMISLTPVDIMNFSKKVNIGKILLPKPNKLYTWPNLLSNDVIGTAFHLKKMYQEIPALMMRHAIGHHCIDFRYLYFAIEL